MSGKSSVDCVAWLGAITGSISLIWQVFVWRRTKPVIRIDSVYLRQDGGDVLSKGLWTATVEFTNIGEQATRITRVGSSHYKTWFHALMNKHGTHAYAGVCGIADIAPLQPMKSDVSIGGFRDKDPREQGLFFVWVKDASRRRATRRRVRR
ncbi:hypothetical protein ACFLSJ_04540 [Verrucomicrobiota bacterium]